MIDTERRVIELAPQIDDVVAGLVRIARIYEEQLGRIDEAIGTYIEALQRAPTHVPIVASLERLPRSVGDYRRLAQVLEHHADASSEPQIKARGRLRAASILELCLDDTDHAAAAHGRVLADVVQRGDDPRVEACRQAALWGLIRLQETRAEWDRVDLTLSTLLESTSEPAARKRVLVRLARNAELRLDDLSRATQLYENALAIGEKPASMAVDRLRLARIEGRRDAIASCLGTMSANTSDVRLENGLLRVLALGFEYRGDDAGATNAAQIYERLIARDDHDLQALDETRARLPDSYPVSADVRTIAMTLGVYAPNVHRGVGREAMVLLTEPRTLVLGSDLLADASGRSLATFHGAYACARIAGNGSVYAAPRQQVIAMLDAAILPAADEQTIRDFRKRIGAALPRKVKKDLERLVTEAPAVDLHAELGAWEAEEHRRALYSAIVLCRDVRAVAQVLATDIATRPRVDERRKAIAANARVREVLEFVTSAACWDVFQRVYGQT